MLARRPYAHCMPTHKYYFWHGALIASTYAFLLLKCYMFERRKGFLPPQHLAQAYARRNKFSIQQDEKKGKWFKVQSLLDFQYWKKMQIMSIRYSMLKRTNIIEIEHLHICMNKPFVAFCWNYIYNSSLSSFIKSVSAEMGYAQSALQPSMLRLVIYSLFSMTETYVVE